MLVKALQQQLQLKLQRRKGLHCPPAFHVRMQIVPEASTHCDRVPPLPTSVCVSQGTEASCATFAPSAPTALVAQQQTALPVVVWAQLPMKVPPAPPNAAANLALVALSVLGALKILTPQEAPRWSVCHVPSTLWHLQVQVPQVPAFPSRALA
jgi:hypothetical protein